MLQPTEAGLISTCLQAILYGFSVCMYIITFWILRRNDHKQYPKRAYAIVTAFLFALNTTGMIANIIRVCQGFLSTRSAAEAVAYFVSPSKATSVIKSCVFDAQSLVLDGVVIYRAWIVWGRDARVVLLPLVAWCGLLASCIGINAAILTSTSQDTGGVFSPRIGRWITCMWSMTLATNVTATALLAYKIWRTSHVGVTWRTPTHVSPALRVVIESGAIYSMSLVVALATFATHSPGHLVVLDLISPLISIVYNMIIIRVGIISDPLFRSGTSTRRDGGSMPSSDRSQRTGEEPLRLGWPRATYDRKIRPLAIEITHYQETDGRSTKVDEGDHISITTSSLSPENAKVTTV